MNFSRLLLSAALCACAWLILAAADTKPDPREKLETAIPEGIRLLEAKDYAAFLKAFLAPDDLKQATQNEPLEKFAAGFGEAKAPRLLKILKGIKDVEPKIYARYETKIDGMDTTITLSKIGPYWQIQNQEPRR